MSVHFDFGPVVDVETFTDGPLMGPQGRMSSSRDWVATESLDDRVHLKIHSQTTHPESLQTNCSLEVLEVSGCSLPASFCVCRSHVQQSFD